ncbi:hypothetical protein QM335_31275, partial [Pseudomonas aeruginosa]|nr:hypothetical protein [Pseudomonas aeruginosa]
QRLLLLRQLYPHLATAQALALLDHGVRQQAYLMAYSDAFYLSCVALLACALASLMLRQKD